MDEPGFRARHRCIVYHLPEAFFAMSCPPRQDGKWSPNGHSERVPCSADSATLGAAVRRSLDRTHEGRPNEIRAAGLVRVFERGAIGVRKVAVSRSDDVIAVSGLRGWEQESGETDAQLGDRVKAALALFD